MIKTMFTYEYYLIKDYVRNVLPRHYSDAMEFPGHKYIKRLCILGYLKCQLIENDNYLILDCPENSSYFNLQNSNKTRSKYSRTIIKHDIKLFMDDALRRVESQTSKKIEKYIDYKSGYISIMNIIPFGLYIQYGIKVDGVYSRRMQIKEVPHIMAALLYKLDPLIDGLPNSGYIKVGRKIKRVKFLY